MAWEIGQPAPAKSHPDRMDYNVWRWGTTSKGGAKPIPGFGHKDRPEFDAFRVTYTKNKKQQKNAAESAVKVADRKETAKKVSDEAASVVSGVINQTQMSQPQASRSVSREAFLPLDKNLHPNAVSHDDSHSRILTDVADKLDSHVGSNKDAEDAMYKGYDDLQKHNLAHSLGYTKLAIKHIKNAAQHFSSAHSMLNREAGPGGLPKVQIGNGAPKTLAEIAQSTAKNYEDTYHGVKKVDQEPTQITPSIAKFLETPKKDKNAWTETPEVESTEDFNKRIAARDAKKKELFELSKDEKRAYTQLNPLRDEVVSESAKNDYQGIRQAISDKQAAKKAANEDLVGIKEKDNGTRAFTIATANKPRVELAIQEAHRHFKQVDEDADAGLIAGSRNDKINALPKRITNLLGTHGVRLALQRYAKMQAAAAPAEPEEQPEEDATSEGVANSNLDNYINNKFSGTRIPKAVTTYNGPTSDEVDEYLGHLHKGNIKKAALAHWASHNKGSMERIETTKASQDPEGYLRDVGLGSSLAGSATAPTSRAQKLGSEFGLGSGR